MTESKKTNCIFMIIGPVLPQKNINTVNISFSDQKIQITFMLFFRHLDDDFRLFFKFLDP